MSKEALKIIAKYPGKVPVICTSSDGAGEKRKLLFPENMGGAEFERLVRVQCPWADEASCVQVGNNAAVSNVSVAELYKMHKGADGFLHALIAKRADSVSARDAAHSHTLGSSKQDEGDTLVKQLKDMEEEVRQVRESSKSKDDLIAKLEGRAASAEEEAASLAKKLHDVEEEHSFTKEVCAGKTSQLQAAEGQLLSLRQELHTMSQENEALQMHMILNEQDKLEAGRAAAAEVALEALKAEHAMAIEEACRGLARKTQELAAESAQKAAAEKAVEQLTKRLATLEEAEAKREEARRSRAAKARELEADGFIDLGCDTPCEDDFDILS